MSKTCVNSFSQVVRMMATNKVFIDKVQAWHCTTCTCQMYKAFQFFLYENRDSDFSSQSSF